MEGKSADVLVVGQWYEDSETEQRFQLLSVAADTVEILDPWGNRRRTNRLLWERDMKPARRVPVVLERRNSGR